jgi:hypothetical protein
MKTTETTTLPAVKQKIMTITPQVAADFLLKNIRNRPLKTENVEFIAYQLKMGKWKTGPDAIAFDYNDNLINGQHRCEACIKTGISFESNVMYNLEPDAYNTIDTGIKRSGGDALSSLGTGFPQVKAALIKMLLLHKKNNLVSQNEGGIKLKITNQMIVDFYTKNSKKVDAATKTGQDVYSSPNRLFSSATIGAFAYIFNEIDEQDSALFFEMFKSGEGLSAKHPVLILRNQLIKDLSGLKKYPTRVKYEWLIECWNAYRANKTITRIIAKGNGTLPKPI